MNHLENACEAVDAGVFSSDQLFDDEQREMLKTYIDRWTRAIKDHEDGLKNDSINSHQKT